MIKEAVILVGGLGTRLRSVISELPKCMAPVAGKPFLYYIINHLEKAGIQKFIFSAGYKNEIIEKYLRKKTTINYQLSVEKEPLGTGGAIKFAIAKSTEKNTLIVNGDTLFSINIAMLSASHKAFNADCTLSLKPMHNFERYGVVELNSDGSIQSFKEKKAYKAGDINGGVYALNVPRFLNEDLPEKFSFEKDYLEKYFDKSKMYGVVQDEYFIDIGIPEDYERAQTELKNK
ncbi:MAG: nucleotidyltransferase family protein [Ginsengibacter sp.]